MVGIKLVDRKEGIQCDFCDAPPPEIDTRVAQLDSRKGPVYFCQDCIVQLAASIGWSLERAAQLLNSADDGAVH